MTVRAISVKKITKSKNVKGKINRKKTKTSSTRLQAKGRFILFDPPHITKIIISLASQHMLRIHT
jgi:hypothetical protein